MNARTSRTYLLVGLGLALGLLAVASLLRAQTSIHKNSFESKIGWTKGWADAPFVELAHKIDDRDPHNGQGCEFIDLDVKQGNAIHYVYATGKAPISDELRVALWVRANRPGIQLLARVVLPNERDPGNLDYAMTTYIKGDMYQQAGQWQLVEISRPTKAAKDQQVLMNADPKYKRNFDFTGAYVDALVLNLNAGPGPTKVWIDDLEVGPVSSPPPTPMPERVDNNNPPKGTESVPPGSKSTAVRFNGNRLMVGDRRMLFRAVRYSDTSVAVLRNAGFTAICFDSNVNPAVVKDAADSGLWIVPEFRVTNDKGVALSPEEITQQINRYADTDALLFHRIGGLLTFEKAADVARGVQAARVADPAHPIAGDVFDGMLPYSRTINMMGVHRFPLMTTLELDKYHDFLVARRKLAAPDAFTWTWIQTHLPDWYAEALYNQSAQAEFKEPVGPQPEQIRLLSYIALASGCRGLGFSSDRFLADSHQGRDRLLCCALVNQEIDMLRDMFVSADDLPQWVDTSVKDIKAAVFRCDQGVLVIPIWQGKFSQIVPGQAAINKLHLVVPQVPKTMQAWEVSPGDVRGLKTERIDKGMKVTLPEFGLTAMVVFTSDTNLMGRFQDQARNHRQLAAQWSHDMALYEYEKVLKVHQALEKMGVTLHDANGLLKEAQNRLVKSKELWTARSFSEAYHEAERALRPVRVLMRAHWEKAVRGLDSPVASPYAVSFYTLPRHWEFMSQKNAASVGVNMLQGGDFELPPERVQDNWKLSEKSLDNVDMSATRVTEMKVPRVKPVEIKTEKEKELEKKQAKNEPKKKDVPVVETPIEGRQCLMLQVKQRGAAPVPPALEQTMIALSSPAVQLPPGTLVQISGWVNIPAPIQASADGALLYDSVGGDPLAIRMTAPTTWKKFTVYRRVPASGAISVTMALTGIGTVYFDDVRIEPLIPAGGIQPVSGNR